MFHGKYFGLVGDPSFDGKTATKREYEAMLVLLDKVAAAGQDGANIEVPEWASAEDRALRALQRGGYVRPTSRSPFASLQLTVQGRVYLDQVTTRSKDTPAEARYREGALLAQLRDAETEEWHERLRKMPPVSFTAEEAYAIAYPKKVRVGQDSVPKSKTTLSSLADDAVDFFLRRQK